MHSRPERRVQRGLPEQGWRVQQQVLLLQVHLVQLVRQVQQQELRLRQLERQQQGLPLQEQRVREVQEGQTDSHLQESSRSAVRN
jgi:hypothetical protein